MPINSTDLVTEARELFNRYQRGNRSVDETMRAFLLLKALCDEVERLRNRFSVLCGNCGERYLGPRDESLRGYNACNMSRRED
jgi:hypothetical protein